MERLPRDRVSAAISERRSYVRTGDQAVSTSSTVPWLTARAPDDHRPDRWLVIGAGRPKEPQSPRDNRFSDAFEARSGARRSNPLHATARPTTGDPSSTWRMALASGTASRRRPERRCEVEPDHLDAVHRRPRGADRVPAGSRFALRAARPPQRGPRRGLMVGAAHARRRIAFKSVRSTSTRTSSPLSSLRVAASRIPGMIARRRTTDRDLVRPRSEHGQIARRRRTSSTPDSRATVLRGKLRNPRRIVWPAQTAGAAREAT